MKNFLISLLLSVIWFASPAPAATGNTAEKVYDGDTFLLRYADGETVTVRLIGIDAPEKGQKYSTESRRLLAGLLIGHDLQIATPGRDKYGRLLAHIFNDGIHVNREMIRLGGAWVYRSFTDDPHFYRAENEARAEGRGLFADPDALPPWIVRKQQSARW